MTDESLFALVGAVFGGAGLKIVERIAARHEKKLDDATLIRQELRTEVASLREGLEELNTQIDLWQKKYYDLQSEYVELKVRYRVVSEEVERLRKQMILSTTSSSSAITLIASTTSNDELAEVDSDDLIDSDDRK